MVSVSPGSKVIRPDWASKSEEERAAPLRVAYSAVIAQTLGMSSLNVIKAVPADSEAVVLSTLTVVYTALRSGTSGRPTLPKGDRCEHSQNSGGRNIAPPCQNRGPAKDERKTVRIRPRVGGQRRRRQQLGEPAPGAGRLRAVFEDVGSGASWNRPG